MAKKKSDPKVHYPENAAKLQVVDYKEHELARISTPEANWIKAIRNYCRENSIAPTTLITAYKELKQQENDNRADSSASY